MADLHFYVGPSYYGGPAMILNCVVGFQDALADFHSLLVLGDEVVVTFRQGFFQSLVQHFRGDKRFHGEESAQHDHVEQLGDTQLVSLVGGGHLIDVDVFAGGVVGDTVRVINQQTAGLHGRFELVHGLLVEDDSGVELVEVRGADALVAEDDGDVGRAATHFRTVGGKPADLFVLHNAGVSQDLTH